MRDVLARIKTIRLAMIIPVIFIIAVFIAMFPGCGGNGTETGDNEEKNEYQTSDDTVQSQEEGHVTYMEGKLEVILDTDLLWGEVGNEHIPQEEELKAATDKIYELAARHNCIVEEFELLGPYGGAIVLMGLPEGKGEEEAITELLEEPLVVEAYRKKTNNQDSGL